MNKKLDRAYYDILDVKKDADDNAIKKAFKKACLIAHPDKGGTNEMFQMVNEAYTVLSDPTQRAEYDRDIKKLGLKDGQGLKTDKEFQRQKTNKENNHQNPTQTVTQQTAAATNYQSQKQNDNVEIPSNFETLNVKELKNLLDKLNVKRDDCFEKEDLINRLREVQNKKEKPQPSKSQNKTKTEYSRKDDSSNFDPNLTEMPKPVSCFFKIISVGNQEVGKSCLIKRYCEGRFVKRYISTIGIDYGVKKLDILNHKVCINFFDLSGNDEYKEIRSEFYKDASGAIAVFDVDNRDSYISLVHWEEEMKRCGCDLNRLKVIVCGNKCESSSREVKEAEASKWAKQRGWEYFETSANEGKNITEAFESLFTSCVKQFIDDKKHFGI